MDEKQFHTNITEQAIDELVDGTSQYAANEECRMTQLEALSAAPDGDHGAGAVAPRPNQHQRVIERTEPQDGQMHQQYVDVESISDTGAVVGNDENDSSPRLELPAEKEPHQRLNGDAGFRKHPPDYPVGFGPALPPLDSSMQMGYDATSNSYPSNVPVPGPVTVRMVDRTPQNRNRFNPYALPSPAIQPTYSDRVLPNSFPRQNQPQQQAPQYGPQWQHHPFQQDSFQWQQSQSQQNPFSPRSYYQQNIVPSNPHQNQYIAQPYTPRSQSFVPPHAHHSQPRTLQHSNPMTPTAPRSQDMGRQQNSHQKRPGPSKHPYFTGPTGGQIWREFNKWKGPRRHVTGKVAISQDRLECANCRELGHKNGKCVKVNSAGFTDGCGWCSQFPVHDIVDCPKLPQDPAKRNKLLLLKLVKERNRLPPMSTKQDILALDGIGGISERPWTPEYALLRERQGYSEEHDHVNDRMGSLYKDPAWTAAESVKPGTMVDPSRLGSNEFPDAHDSGDEDINGLKKDLE